MIKFSGSFTVFLDPFARIETRLFEEQETEATLSIASVYATLIMSPVFNDPAKVPAIISKALSRDLSFSFKDIVDCHFGADKLDLYLSFRSKAILLKEHSVIRIRLVSTLACELEGGRVLTDSEALSYAHERATQIIQDMKSPYYPTGIKANDILQQINACSASASYKARVAYPFYDKHTVRLGTVCKMSFIGVDELKEAIGRTNLAELLNNTQHGAHTCLLLTINDVGRFLIPLSPATSFTFFQQDREVTLLLPVYFKSKRSLSMEPIIIIFKRNTTFSAFRKEFCSYISASSTPNSQQTSTSTPRTGAKESAVHTYITKSLDVIVGSSCMLSSPECHEIGNTQELDGADIGYVDCQSASVSAGNVYTIDADHHQNAAAIIFRSMRGNQHSDNFCFAATDTCVAAVTGRTLDLVQLERSGRGVFSARSCELKETHFVPSRIRFDYSFNSSGLIFACSGKDASSIGLLATKYAPSSVLNIDAATTEKGKGSRGQILDTGEGGDNYSLYGFDTSTGNACERLLLYNVSAGCSITLKDFDICKHSWQPPTIIGCNISPAAGIVGITKSSIQLIDRRLSGSTNLTGCSWSYKGNASLSALCLSTQGNLTVGNENGDITLFHSTSRASTLFGGFGYPIIGLHLTANEEWLVATMPTIIAVYYLKGETSNAFKCNGLKFSERQPPRLLRLTQELMTVLLAEMPQHSSPFQFTPASLSPDEKFLVSSTGGCVIVWDFEQVCFGVTDHGSASILKLPTGVLGVGLMADYEGDEPIQYFSTITAANIDILRYKPSTPLLL